MISSKVDLTEHNDFGNRLIEFDRIPENEGTVKYEGFSEESVSSLLGNGVDTFFRLNKLFGSNVHRDERGRVFNNQWKYDSNCDRDISQEIYCARCGRLLIPWDNNFGLCRCCSEETSRLFIEKCPWKIKESIRTHNSKDLFNLR